MLPVGLRDEGGCAGITQPQSLALDSRTARICKMSRHELSQLVLCEFSERLVDFALRPPEDVDECTSFIVAITELITVRDSAFLFRQHHTFQRVPMGFL